MLYFTAKALGAHGGLHGAHKIHNIYWQCISLLYFRSLPQDCYRTYEHNLFGLIMDQSTGDFLISERAEILYSMSLFLLKGFLSEQSRLFHCLAIVSVTYPHCNCSASWNLCKLFSFHLSSGTYAAASAVYKCLMLFLGCWKLLCCPERIPHFFRRSVIYFSHVSMQYNVLNAHCIFLILSSLSACWVQAIVSFRLQVYVLLLMVLVLKSNSLGSGLQATCMYILTCNDWFHGSITFILQWISLFESLGCILSSEFCWNLSRLPVLCWLKIITQKKWLEGLYVIHC